MYTHTFSSGPSITVHLSGNKANLSQVTLVFGTRFICSWDKSLSPQPFLNWLEAYSLKAPISAAGLLDIEHLPPFHQEALTYLQTLPFGQTASYKQIAEALENPRAARAVGNACNKNPFPLFIPCHRVIAAQGKLGGFAIDMRIKQALLEFEAVE
jgi:methylated-DNA-[protein]-cysteine S-methyltransferase